MSEATTILNFTFVTHKVISPLETLQTKKYENYGETMHITKEQNVEFRYKEETSTLNYIAI